MSNNYKQNGFTLIEIIIVLAIAAIFTSFAVPSYNSTMNRSELRDSEAGLSEAFRRAKAIARSRNTNVTVSVVSGSNVITLSSADSSLVKADGTAVTVLLSPNVTVGATAAFIFSPLGTVNATGSIVLTSTRDTNLTKTLTIVNTMAQFTSSSSY